MYYYIHSYYSTEICITINKKYFYNIGIITYWYESIPGCWTGFFRNEHAIRIKHLHIPQILNHETEWPCGSILGSSWPTLWSDQHWLNNSSKYALHNATLLLPSCYVSFPFYITQDIRCSFIWFLTLEDFKDEKYGMKSKHE